MSAAACSRRATAFWRSLSWHRGPTIDQVADPTMLGPVVAGLVAKARKSANMYGQDSD